MMAKPSNSRPLAQLFILYTIGILRLAGSQDLVLRKSETRGDLRCGKGYLTPNGLPAVCGKALPYLSNGLIKNTFLIFPNLVILRSYIANNHIKIFYSKYSRNSEDKRRVRINNEVVETPFQEDLTEADILTDSPPSLNVARGAGSKSRFSRGKGASTRPSV